MTENSPNAAPASKSSPESTPKKRGIAGRIVLVAILLVITGLVLFVRTERGSKFFGMAIEATEKWFEGGSPEKEKVAAAKIEELDFMVVREGAEQRVTSIQRKGKHVDKQVFELLPDLYCIGTVNLGDTDITDEQLKSIKSLRRLSSLLLGGTGITDEGLVQLRNLGALESLHLQNTKITDAGLENLVAVPNLTILDISGTKLTDAGLKTIAKCKKLNWLLMKNTPITDEGIKALKDLPHLGRLTIFNTKITSTGIDELLKTFPKLKTDTGDMPEPVVTNPNQADRSPESEQKTE